MTGRRMRGNQRHRSRPAPQTGEAPDSESNDLRMLCGALGFWRVCGKPPCRRARACKGDAQACFRTFWWQMPEQARVWVRAAVSASAGGLGNDAVARAADAEVARWRELQMRFAPKAATSELEQRPANEPEPAPMPRIRAL